jgi:hypothetical protein
LPSLEGPTLLLAAIALMHGLSASDFSRAQAMLEHLASRWPRHPEPHAWLAHLHLLRWQQEGSPDTAAQARAEAAQALQCDGGGSLPLAMEGRIKALLGGDLHAAQQRYGQALALQPADALALLFRAEVKALQGDGTAARADAVRAGAALPLSPLLSLHALVGAQAALADGDAREALSLARQCLERSPLCVAAHCTLVAAQVACGQVDLARETLACLRQRMPELRAGLGRMPQGVLRRRIADALGELEVREA